MGNGQDVEYAGPSRSIGFTLADVQPPSRVYVTNDDLLRIEIYGSVANIGVLVGIRLLSPDGNVVYNAFTVTQDGSRTTFTQVVSLGEGFLLSATARPTSDCQRGQVWVNISLQKGTVAVTIQSTLIQGYLAFRQNLSWPESPPDQFVSGKGNLRTIVGTSPAAGAEISEVVPSGATWQLRAFQAVLTTAVAVANRTPRLTLDDGTNQFFRGESSLVQAASLTKTHQWGQNLVLTTAPIDTATMALPGPMLITAGYRIRTLTANIQAADQYAAPIYQVEEWLEF